MATKPCPFCAEEIQESARICRYCKARLDGGPQLESDPEDFQALQRAPKVSKDFQAWRVTRGGDPADPWRIGGWTIFCFLITALLFSIPFLSPPGRNDERILIAILISMWTGIPFIILLIYDLFKTRPSKCADPAKAVKKYYASLRFKTRYKRAYTWWLAAPDKNDAPRKTPFIETVTEPSETHNFRERIGFVEYWKRIAGSNFGSQRQLKCTVDSVTSIAPGYAVANLRVQVTRMPTWPIWLLLVGCGALIIVILQSSLRKDHTWALQKLLVERDGRWWVVNGEIGDAMDRALASEIQHPTNSELEL